ncbi:MAG: magnetochrome domain-containing protein [Candidatus Omnitrophica bacterium]|nr:magnetochrome domain-containing protein [Candidatus Omnitrophota bacterium]
MQPVAYVPPNCATCPNVTQCFPNAGNSMQPVAYAPRRFPNVGNSMQPVAYVPPNCATCPNVTQCFPNAGPMQPVAMTQTIPPPPIYTNAIMPHGYRGVCSNCHTVLNLQNQVIAGPM